MHRFVKLGVEGKKVFLYKEKDLGKKARQVLWGDFLNVVEDDNGDGWLKIAWGTSSGQPLHYFARADETSVDRPLEIIFLDVGQGDSAVLITPERGADERIMLVDAGISDNLDRFLAWRFKYKTRALPIHAAIITHPDEDHYGGFRPVFANPLVEIAHIHHNGLAERAGANRLGPKAKDPANNKTYHTDIKVSDADMRGFYGNLAPFGKMEYPALLNAAINNPRIADMSMMSTDHGTKEGGKTWLPGFAPADNRGFTIEVLGPVVEPDGAGNPRLRRLGSDGKTKNGHSVLLRLSFGGFTIFFGGDLNKNAEKFLLAHYAGLEKWPNSAETRAAMVRSASTRIRSDFMKVCHHGAADVTDEFIMAVDPAAFVVSSGDAEGHVHPRPDLLGRLGRNGRGFAPLILSTELQRSTREKEDQKLGAAVLAEAESLANLAGNNPETPAKRRKRLDKIIEKTDVLMRRNVEVYGAIHVKTDGNRMIAAFRIESNSKKKLWHYYEYRQDANGTLVALHEVTP